MHFAKPLLYLILALALIRGLIYASVVPPWQAPDEPAHFERARAALTAADWRGNPQEDPPWYDALTASLFTYNFFDHLSHPKFNTEPGGRLTHYIGLYHEIYGGLYGSRPAYALMGWPLFLFRHQDITLQLYLVRLNTVLMNMGIILLAYLTTRTIFPDDTFLAIGVPVLILFNPQHTHLLSTVNNGNLAELLATAALFFMVRGVVKGFSWLTVLAVLALSLAAMWTKATAYFLPFAIGSIGLFYLWRYRQQWRWLVPTGLLIIGLIFYFAPARLKDLLGQAWFWFQAGQINFNPVVPQDLFRSFWAMPGWFNLRLHPFWYQLLLVVCLLAVGGLIWLVVSKRHLFLSTAYQPRLQALVVLAVAATVALGVLLGWHVITGSGVYRQGRSIYPVIVPISLFLVLGWRQLIPSSWRGTALLAISLGLFLFDSMVLIYYILPFFYTRF